MAKYLGSLNTGDFAYREPVYYTDTTGEDRSTAILRLSLKADNFNFTTAKEDGTDFRLANSAGGHGVFHMWKCYWSQTYQRGDFFFKIPDVYANQSYTYYAFWGNPTATGISDPDEMGFDFYYEFPTTGGGNGVTIDTSKWNGTTYNVSTEKGWRHWGETRTSTNPFYGKRSWILEMGVHLEPENTQWNYNAYTLKFNFVDAIDNGFYWNIYAKDLFGHTATAEGQSGGEYQVVNESGGIEADGFSNVILYYHEPTDKVYYAIYDKDTEADSAIGSASRKVHGNTELNNLQLNSAPYAGGNTYGPYYLSLRWIIVRSYDTYGYDRLDARDLKVSYDNIWHPPFSAIEYGPDLVDTKYYHATTSGGVPENLSIKLADNVSNIWISDEVEAEPEETTDKTIINDPGAPWVESGWYDYGLRVVYDKSLFSYTRFSNFIKIQVKKYIWGNTKITHLYMGPGAETGNPYNFAEEPIQITFNGGESELFVDQDGLQSDPIEYQIDYTKNLVFSFGFQDSSYDDNLIRNNYHGSKVYSYRKAGGFSEITDLEVSGYTARNESMVIEKVLGGTFSDGAAAIIDFGKGADRITNQLLHFDSCHELFYGAGKLSDDDTNSQGRDYWHCTTTSGWVAVDLGEYIAVESFTIIPNNASVMPKDYVFYGSNYDPRFYREEWVTLTSGTFTQDTRRQSVQFVCGNTHRYYILDCLSSYGSELKLQEWSVHGTEGTTKKPVIQKLSIHPSLASGYTDYFPKEIRFLGSNNMLDWYEILDFTPTYTPYYKFNGLDYWQEYYFTNERGYWMFKLDTRDNWEGDAGIKSIGMWAMHETAEEEYIHRILVDDTDNIQEIWASAGCGFDDTYGLVYIAGSKLNVVQGNRVVRIEDLPDNYIDIAAGG
jgi:hypothetical protein